ncbi:MAG: ATP-binding protein, partial [Thermomicrobiales bacterium]
MRLVRVRIRNFKLLEDVQLDFSTDSQRPLTVVRAENGSGKTSLMNALLWAFYGLEGLPPLARGLRLTSAAAPMGRPIDVSVMVEFEHTDDNALTTSYRLIRTVSETPTVGDEVSRTNERTRLLRITRAGEEDVQPADALISKFVPRHLREVFFTNGDDVQTFISGRAGTQQRQGQVHKAIQALLGLDALRLAAGDVDATFRNLRAEAAKSAGAGVEAAEKDLEKTDEKLETLAAQREDLGSKLSNMVERKASDEKELTALRGIGDIEALNRRILALRSELDRLEGGRGRSILRMREALRSEACSWGLIGDSIEKGIEILSDLADRHVIPGTSVEVLADRLELGECICGEPLAAGSAHRAAVEKLLSEQRRTDIRQQRLTALFHTARQSKASHDANVDARSDFVGRRGELLQEFIDARDLLREKGLELRGLEEKRAQIDEERVRNLAERIAKVDSQISEANTKLGEIRAELTHFGEIKQTQELRLKEVERVARIGGDLATKRDVAGDLASLVKGALEVLEGDYVKRVSDRMADLFMGVVGSHADFDAAVFRGVHLADNFDIIVDTHDGRQLDPDFELNGASQRALTLSFIWSLMEVSGTTAPRIIDSPIGFVAGGVKSRMIDAITQPASGALPD